MTKALNILAVAVVLAAAGNARADVASGIPNRPPSDPCSYRGGTSVGMAWPLWATTSGAQPVVINGNPTYTNPGDPIHDWYPSTFNTCTEGDFDGAIVVLALECFVTAPAQRQVRYLKKTFVYRWHGGAMERTVESPSLESHGSPGLASVYMEPSWSGSVFSWQIAGAPGKDLAWQCGPVSPSMAYWSRGN